MTLKRIRSKVQLGPNRTQLDLVRVSCCERGCGLCNGQGWVLVPLAWLWTRKLILHGVLS